MSRPSFAERLLRGLVTDPALGDAILGDLTEEWQTRITRDGRVSADLWYWGQTIRTMPHLLRDWWVTATRRDVRLRLAGIVVVFGIAAQAWRYWWITIADITYARVQWLTACTISGSHSSSISPEERRRDDRPAAASMVDSSATARYPSDVWLAGEQVVSPTWSARGASALPASSARR